MIKRPLASLLVVAVTILAFGSAIAAGDAAKEITTAEFHAHMAATVKNVGMVHTHLHHVLNCLVGPKGKLFDTHALDPCKGMGNGAISDFTGSPAARAKLEMAVKTADQGLRETKFEQAHATAVKVEALLKEANVPT